MYIVGGSPPKIEDHEEVEIMGKEVPVPLTSTGAMGPLIESFIFDAKKGDCKHG